ncbi:MAG: hypothetical protein B6D55_08430 [Candidatus Omnitrophica bacterium 4484_70.2]|nr:MAG: hypothetical protein B6D55_08430 [Candidatus Omnitrophica bacterium 4484_70.2]
MKRKIKVLSTFLLVSLFFYSGCATVSTPRIMLLKHAESSFKDYQFPSVEEIKNNSIASRQFSYTNYVPGKRELLFLKKIKKRLPSNYFILYPIKYILLKSGIIFSVKINLKEV